MLDPRKQTALLSAAAVVNLRTLPMTTAVVCKQADRYTRCLQA